MRKEVFELFDDFSKLTKRADKIKFLQQVGDEYPAFKDVLRGTFDPTLKFVLPEGNPRYTPNRPQSVPNSLLRLHRQFGDFVEGARAQDLGQLRVETRFIQLLERIHAEDALIVLSMKDKKSPVKGLTKKLVQEAFPKMIASS